jgi:hypothetical protein
MVLDGLEAHVKAKVEHMKGRRKTIKGKRKMFSPKVHVVRYADDFVVTAATKR